MPALNYELYKCRYHGCFIYQRLIPTVLKPIWTGWKGLMVCISTLLQVQWCHFVSLKSTMWESIHYRDWQTLQIGVSDFFFLRELAFKHLPEYLCLLVVWHMLVFLYKWRIVSWTIKIPTNRLMLWEVLQIEFIHNLIFWSIYGQGTPFQLTFLNITQKWHIFLFLFCLSLLFFSQQFVMPPQKTTLPSYISFSWEMVR